jgi:transcriptional regulator with PAS, ATPase and Fis domain
LTPAHELHPPVDSIGRKTRALKKTSGNRTHAARLLEISYPSLLSKIKAYEIAL